MKKKIFLGLGIIAFSFSLFAFSNDIKSAINCIKCGGKGTIPVKEDCPICKGAKKDKWGENCYRCGGDGYVIKDITCPECGGDGQQKKPVPFPEPRK